MLSLLLAIVSSTVVALILRLAPSKRRFTLFCLNYLAGATAGVVVHLIHGDTIELSVAELAMSVGLGGTYVLGLLSFSRAIKMLGTGIASSVARLSVAIPILVSVFVFGEAGSWLQTAAIAMAITILPLASRDWPPFHRRRDHASGGALPIAAAVFLVIGVADTMLKVREEVFGGSGPLGFVTVVFASAAVASGAIALARGELRSDRGTPRSQMLIGLPLGVANFGSAFFMASAVRSMDGPFAYAVNAVGVIVLTSLLGVILFGERLRSHNYAFLALSITTVVILQLTAT